MQRHFKVQTRKTAWMTTDPQSPQVSPFQYKSRTEKYKANCCIVGRDDFVEELKENHVMTLTFKQGILATH